MFGIISQTTFLSFVVAGVWLWEVSVPVKMIVLASAGSIFFFLQYQVGFLFEQHQRVTAETNTKLNSDGHGKSAHAETMSRTGGAILSTYDTPSWVIDALSMFFWFICAVAESSAWVTIYHRFA